MLSNVLACATVNKYSEEEYLEAEQIAVLVWKKTRYYSEFSIVNIEYKKDNDMYYIYIETDDNKKHEICVDMSSKDKFGQYRFEIKE